MGSSGYTQGVGIANLVSKKPCRDNAGVRLQRSGQDKLTQLLKQLILQRDRVASIDLQWQVHGFLCWISMEN